MSRCGQVVIIERETKSQAINVASNEEEPKRENAHASKTGKRLANRRGVVSGPGWNSDAILHERGKERGDARKR
jgi:hypothetical protein